MHDDEPPSWFKLAYYLIYIVIMITFCLAMAALMPHAKGQRP